MESVKKLNDKVESLNLERENIDELLKETRGKIDEITFTPEELEKKRVEREMQQAEYKINSLKQEFNHVFNELKTRVNLELIQQDFYIKNDIIMSDLRNKIHDQEKELKILGNDSNKENTKYRFKQINIDKYQPSVNRHKKVVTILFIILFILLLFTLFKIYKLETPYNDKKMFIIMIAIILIGTIVFNIIKKIIF